MSELNVNVIDHPLIQHKLTIMRQKETSTKGFRELLREIAMLMTFEVTRGFPVKDIEIETPVAPCIGKQIDGKKLVVVPILRAGLGLLDGVLDLIPSAKVGHIGLYRDHETLEPMIVTERVFKRNYTRREWFKLKHYLKAKISVLKQELGFNIRISFDKDFIDYIHYKEEWWTWAQRQKKSQP